MDRTKSRIKIGGVRISVSFLLDEFALGTTALLLGLFVLRNFREG
jgi:hypothetical protein